MALESGRDVLEERQAEIRRLGQLIHELEQENGSLLREGRALKRALKPRERAIAKAVRERGGNGLSQPSTY